MWKGILSVDFLSEENNLEEKENTLPFNNFVSLRQLPALGQCLATLAGAMPVAFLEPKLNTHNPCSVFNTKSARDRAGELQIDDKSQAFIILEQFPPLPTDTCKNSTTWYY